jgi:hypothetical protein
VGAKSFKVSFCEKNKKDEKRTPHGTIKFEDEKANIFSLKLFSFLCKEY